jgi:hypothetical protein
MFFTEIYSAFGRRILDADVVVEEGNDPTGLLLPPRCNAAMNSGIPGNKTEICALVKPTRPLQKMINRNSSKTVLFRPSAQCCKMKISFGQLCPKGPKPKTLKLQQHSNR